jgi:hypothetical protein
MSILLRSEASAALLVTGFLYQHLYPGTWLYFALLFLLPDVSLLAYATPSKQFAAAIYNVFHCSVLPLALALLSWHNDWLRSEQVALIWLAHIEFDRMLGFGLKYPGSFKLTHIQRVGA